MGESGHKGCGKLTAQPGLVTFSTRSKRSFSVRCRFAKSTRGRRYRWFYDSPWVAISITMEAAKLVTAVWLARWHVTAWIWRFVLVLLVAGLAIINAAGVFSQLVAAHVGERGAAVAGLETQDATLAARIEVAAHNVADLDQRLGQIDSAIEEATRRGRTNTALSAIEGQRKARAAR